MMVKNDILFKRPFLSFEQHGLLVGAYDIPCDTHVIPCDLCKPIHIAYWAVTDFRQSLPALDAFKIVLM